MTGSAMRSELGPGERITRRNRRRMFVFLGASLVLGAVLGSAMSAFDTSNVDGFAPAAIRMAPLPALLLAIGFVVGLIAVPLYLFRIVDEVKVRQNMQAMTAGCIAVTGGYPAWQALAAGGWLPQPSAWGVFLLGYGVMVIAALAMKLRG